MHLTKYQKDLFIKARDLFHAAHARVEERPESCEGTEQYICWQLIFAATGATTHRTQGLNNLEDAQDFCIPEAKEVFRQINRALDGYVTLSSWVAINMKRNEVSTRLYEEKALDYLARSAWLDRIIETGELK